MTANSGGSTVSLVNTEPMTFSTTPLTTECNYGVSPATDIISYKGYRSPHRNVPSATTAELMPYETRSATSAKHHLMNRTQAVGFRFPQIQGGACSRHY
ncbi:hypothetical protein EDB81DRAFT_886175 [Dactylonectria macrodidyma]|uniref:Uncharacterized protein n=1 Tax=Dactylonectria macrodidyma TaxID=307937 RepID=A0A9P9EIT0_9HYPO|nr:hypothetical protein EDB81DRAFT_886175 [Dactylonectria macrodidyma]